MQSFLCRHLVPASELKMLYEEGVLTEAFYKQKLDEREALQ